MGSSWNNRITYIQPGDPEAWVDFPEPRKVSPSFMFSDAVQCDICRGYGGWNLLLGAYPSIGKDSTSENRHLFSHMKATCHACAGHGWISVAHRSCVHEYRWGGVSNQFTYFACVHCKSTISWDTRRKK